MVILIREKKCCREVASVLRLEWRFFLRDFGLSILCVGLMLSCTGFLEDNDSNILTSESIVRSVEIDEGSDGAPREGIPKAETKGSSRGESRFPEKPFASIEPATAPTDSGLRAGFADDNKQFNHFVRFLDQYGTDVEHLKLPIQERILLRIKDEDGKPIPNALVSVYAEDQFLCDGFSYADGLFLFFPAEYGSDSREYRALIAYQQKTIEVVFQREGKREIEARFDIPRHFPEKVPLDIAFILDTTGSMGEEITRLKLTIELINLNLTALKINPRVRFALVLYKDIGYEYVTKVVQLTEELNSFQASLASVGASGGGDEPEDLQAALREAMQSISWNKSGVRLAFIITDAPAHLDYGQQYTYVHAAHDARSKGIKIFSVGTGGLILAGEYMLRQISQYTAAKYIFLTYEETGESEGGKPGSVSHHTGSNYQADKLESIIIRIAKEELSHLSDIPIESEEEYFAAVKVADESGEQTLSTLFNRALEQLIDYSMFHIPLEIATGVLPVNPVNENLELDAEYFTEQLVLALSRNETFRIVERKDLQSLLEELEFQMSGLVKDEDVQQIGNFLGAELLVSSRMYAKDKDYELFLKLTRVETGEILSVTKTRIDKRLGL